LRGPFCPQSTVNAIWKQDLAEFDEQVKELAES
jgi:hypothetical protein